LSEPFFVLATQNPIEQEGTYPLPEAQLDRFMFNIFVDYPSEEEEFQIVKQTTADVPVEVTPTLTADEINSESIIVNGKPLELTGGGLTVIDGQNDGSIDGVKKNPDGSTSVDISGSDVTRGGVAIVQ